MSVSNPIENAKFSGTMEFPEGSGTTGSTYLSVRTDELEGSGNGLDPLDASTFELFDGHLRDAPEGQNIFLGEGTFETEGAQDRSAPGHPLPRGFIPKKNWLIKGKGMYKTTIKLMALKYSEPQPDYEAVAIGDPGGSTDMSGTTIEDLTIDCNRPDLDPGDHALRISAVGLLGSNCTIRNVRVINAGGDWSSRLECFLLNIASPVGLTDPLDEVTDGLMEGCVVESPDPTSDYGYAFVMTQVRNGIIRNCTARDWGGTAAFGCGGGTNMQLLNNKAVDCGLFFYSEPNNGNLDTDGITLSGNLAIVGRGNPALSIGPDGGFGGFMLILGNDQPDQLKVRNVTLENNTVILRPKDGDTSNFNAALISAGVAFPDIQSNFSISNNHVFYDTRATPGIPFTGYGLQYIDNLDVVNNHFEVKAPINSATHCTNVNTVILGDTKDTILASPIKISGTKSADNQACLYRFGTSYVIVDGDHFQCEVYSDDGNLAHNPLISIEATNLNTLKDQNGQLGYEDVGSHCKGKWYFRDFDLSDYAGDTTNFLELGFIGGLPSGGFIPNGAYSFYYRNVKIVNSAGVAAINYFTQDDYIIPSNSVQTVGSPAISLNMGAGRTGYQAIAYAASITPSSQNEVVSVGTLTGNISIANPSGVPQDGMRLVFEFTQDATGTRTYTWGTAYAFGTDYTNAMLPTTANAKCEAEFRYYKSLGKWRCIGIARGF